MIDPRHEAILIRDANGRLEDKTRDVASCRTDGARTHITYAKSSKPYSYRAQNVVILRDAVVVPVPDGARAEVQGEVWNSHTEVRCFTAPTGRWLRVFYRTKAGEQHRTYLAEQVRIIHNAAEEASATTVLDYWREVIAGLQKDDPLRPAYERLEFIHPESALARYLRGTPIDSAERSGPLIFPFAVNTSQRQAVANALSHPISVIDGPPGTGKTETILNLIANILQTPGQTVGVVSFSNAAVDNVRDKLAKKGFGFAVANMGNKSKRDEFFEGQSARNAKVDELVDAPDISLPPAGQLVELDHRLRHMHAEAEQLASLQVTVNAYQLERQHFDQYAERHELPEIADIPLLRRSSEHILDYLADTRPEAYDDGRIAQLTRRFRQYLRFGSSRGLDPSDTTTVLQLQRAFYDKKIDELQRNAQQRKDALTRENFDDLSNQHQHLSEQILRAGLQQRYTNLARTTYSPHDLGRRFSQDYPVMLSTCHSIAASMSDRRLLDYLIIDEASQVNLLAAGLALACARNVLVVGDLRQIQHIADESAATLVAPARAYDYRHHNILSAFIELYGESLPRTMLREHYRCDPAIIGFCNKKFYNGELIPFTESAPDGQPLAVVSMPPGNHMRLHRAGGRSNQREVDAIVREVLPAQLVDVPPEEIGVATPFRLQVNKVNDSLPDIEADTVHKFQGREKDLIIMTTVLDDSKRGRERIDFVDNPNLVNVAVSRAKKRFVLVTNNELMPTSRNLSDLIGYIRYHDPERDVIESQVVSIFDLLYREYSPRLEPLARRLTGDSKHKSENIVWTLLHDIVAQAPYDGLVVTSQVLLHNLLPDLAQLTSEQTAYVMHRASVDLVLYNKTTNELVLAIEVDGFKYHENNPRQLARDALKNAICRTYEIPLLRLPTTGSDEERRIRQALDHAMNLSRSDASDTVRWIR